MMQMVKTLGSIIAAASLLMLCGCGLDEREVAVEGAKPSGTKTPDIDTSQSAPRYTVTDLGSLGGKSTFATSINNKGQVVGRSSMLGGDMFDVPHRAFLWDNDQMRQLRVPPGKDGDSVAMDINDKSQVLVEGISGSSGVFLWQNGKVQELVISPARGYIHHAAAINNEGQVVGTAHTGGTLYRAFLWDNGEVTDLGTLGGRNSEAYSINDKGQVVGSAYTRGAPVHAFVWHKGKMQDLGSLSSGFSGANDINNQGQVVGESVTPIERWVGGRLRRDKHAFLWEEGKMQDLGTLGGRHSEAKAINNKGDVVGSAETEVKKPGRPAIKHAFLYRNGKMHDLNSLIPAESGWVLVEAHDINDDGQIVGMGTIKGRSHAFLLTPLPVNGSTAD